MRGFRFGVFFYRVQKSSVQNPAFHLRARRLGASCAVQMIGRSTYGMAFSATY
jgi:hypothetical protein